MCGINGIFSAKSLPNLKERLSAMNKSIAHRGPDDNGIELFDINKGFGHQRLSIIDLDKRSSQPMSSTNGNVWIVFNGEIFNYKELRRILNKSYKFNTESDTEVLIAGYQSKGIEWVLDNINGMFAFAIYDTRESKLILARDRFGIKPLFYYMDDSTLVFSSEIKGVLSSGMVDAEFNEGAIDEYLAYRHIHEPNTFFKNIYQVESSTYHEYDMSNVSLDIKKYWALPDLNMEVQESLSNEEIINATRQQLARAIQDWEVADVKVGTYLSGGLDSSLTTAIICSHRKSPVDTYTIGFREDGFNEFYFSQLVAELYKTNHHEFTIDKNEYIDEWKSLISFKDAPIAVPNEIPLAIMTRGLSKDITVVVSGEGADELFGGYGRIFRLPFDHRNHFSSADFVDTFIAEYEYIPKTIRDKLLITNNEDSRKNFLKKVRFEFKNRPNEENVFRFFHLFHIKGLLSRLDTTTMQASIEARPPFLDHKLIEYCYREIPYDLKLRWNNEVAREESKKMFAKHYSESKDIPKYILKKVAEPYLPQEIIYRKKMGFPVPLTEWFPSLVEMARIELDKANWINKSELSLLFDKLNIDDTGRAGQILWMFLNIQLFYEQYFKREWKW